MQDPPFVFDVTHQDFQTAVLDNSHRLPVLVDFWAAWCQPCQILMPLLKRLAVEAQGAFLLAKVNADQEPELAARCGVRGLPTVKVFRNGKAVEDLVGVQPEPVYRSVIERYRIKAADRLLEKAETAWRQGHQQAALTLLREAQSLEPDNAEVKLALAEKLLAGGELQAAQQLLQALPLNIQESERVKALTSQMEFIELVRNAPGIAELINIVGAQPDDCAARRQLAARHVLNGDLEAALEQFLEILRRDRNFADEAGRKGLLAVFNLLGSDHPLVGRYRRQMFTLLH